MFEYNAEDYIEEAETEKGFGHRGYRYRVLDRQKLHPTHHTNSLEDAKTWSRKCIAYWLEQDALAEQN